MSGPNPTFCQEQREMLIYFARHGQTDDNRNGIIQGQLDTPLNDHGRREAELLANHLAEMPFGEIWSSSLSRASETASILAARHSGLAVNTDPGLMERGLGSLEGRRRLVGEGLPSDVEAADRFRNRISAWFKTFLATHLPDSPSDQVISAAHDDKRSILVVSHGAYLSTFLSLLLSPDYFNFAAAPELDTRRTCFNTSFMRVRVSRSSQGGHTGEVLSWGEVPHLDGLIQKGHKGGQRIADDVKA